MFIYIDMYVTPKQLAQAIGVSESSLKRWCDRGIIPTTRTPGGHRRLALNDVMQFLRRSGRPLARPEVLGLPSNTGKSEAIIDRAAALLEPALVTGDEEQCRRLVLDLYLAGHSACEIFDRVISPAFHGIGERWSCGDAAVYEERRACEIATRLIYECRTALPRIAETSPVAVGATLKGDPYRLATMMAEVALREAGWRANSLGCDLPAGTLCDAIRVVRPRLFWLSASSIPNEADFVADCRRIFQATTKVGSALAVGGRALDEVTRTRIEYSVYCDDLAHLVAFAATLRF